MEKNHFVNIRLLSPLLLIFCFNVRVNYPFTSSHSPVYVFVVLKSSSVSKVNRVVRWSLTYEGRTVTGR